MSKEVIVLIFATDLDGTMIYSHRVVVGFEDTLHCVEYYDGKPITYMTFPAVQKLEYLLDRIHVIPATTRSISQLKRVEFFSTTKFAIADNGGAILHNGIIDKKWQSHILDILDMYNFEKVLEIFYKLPTLISKPTIVDNCFVFVKAENTMLCKQILEYQLDAKIWQLSFQGKKIYAIPKEISKGNALRYICENLISNFSYVIASGDSHLDISMLEYSDYALIPSDCILASLNKDKKFINVGSGIYSAEQILEFVIENKLKH